MDRKETPFIGSLASRVPRQTGSDSSAASQLPRPLNGAEHSSQVHSLSALASQQKQVVTTKVEIVPMDLHHPILREFPEHREVIRRLKGSNEHFRNVFDEYHRLDDEIYRIEEDIDFATDQEIEELKMRRAKLKDYLYHIIRHAPAVSVACEVGLEAP
jgi:hypothetical protein